ncbi:unknown protein [Seminavis robusta]|uniref:Uncharacterized protein n=1 Tax=Seminavis robusta TaxID=568900 RepID=A0A9N8DFT6_9STRA|nr:unknown protein [Seminavis robusta]|eukprot:Sro72_g039920.1 n/a (275) ;mRNA; r:77853-78852
MCHLSQEAKAQQVAKIGSANHSSRESQKAKSSQGIHLENVSEYIDDLIKTLGYTKTAQIVRVQRSLLKGKSAELYQSFYIKRFTQEVTSEDQQKKALSQVMNDMALKIFADGAWAARSQKRYMRNNLFMGNMDPEKFADRLEKLNDYLKYFPIDKVEMEHPPNKKLDWDELVDIMDYSTPRRWHPLMPSQGKQPHLFKSFNEAVTYYQRLYKADLLSRKLSEANGFNGGNNGGGGGPGAVVQNLTRGLTRTTIEQDGIPKPVGDHGGPSLAHKI